LQTFLCAYYNSTATHSELVQTYAEVQKKVCLAKGHSLEKFSRLNFSGKENKRSADAFLADVVPALEFYTTTVINGSFKH